MFNIAGASLSLPSEVCFIINSERGKYVFNGRCFILSEQKKLLDYYHCQITLILQQGFLEKGTL